MITVSTIILVVVTFFTQLVPFLVLLCSLVAHAQK